MKTAIVDIQDSPELQKQMIKTGFKYAQKFKDDQIAVNIMEVYTECMK